MTYSPLSVPSLPTIPSTSPLLPSPSFTLPISISPSSPCTLYASSNASFSGNYECDPEAFLLHNSTASPPDLEGSPPPAPLTATEWTRIVAFTLIFIVGVVGNVLVVVTLLHHRNLRTVTNVFLLNLAVSDLLLGVFCMPFTLVGSLLQDFVFGSLMCRLIPYMQAVSVSVSVWTLVAISLERFYAICQPLKSRRWQTPSHAYRVIAGVWTASLLFMTPIAILSTLLPIKKYPERHKCREIWPSLATERTFTIILTVTLLLVPLVVMVAAYMKVVRTLWLGVKIQRSNTSPCGTPALRVTTVEGLSSDHLCASSEEKPPTNSSSSSSLLRKGFSIRFHKKPTLSEEKVNKIQNDDGGGDLHDEVSGQGLESTSPELPSRFEGRRSLRRMWRKSKDAKENQFSEKQPWGGLRSSHSERSIIAKRRVVRMLFVLVVEFFVCWTPLFVVNLLSLYIPRQVYAALGSVGVSLVQLLAYVSSCCNPITYCFMNAKFLQSFKQTFGCAHRRTDSFYSTNTRQSFRDGERYNHVSLSVRRNREAQQEPFGNRLQQPLHQHHHHGYSAT